MQKVLFLIGLPASGKTTFSKQYCKKHPSYVRVCRDDLRYMRGRYWMPRQEDLISKWEISCILDALSERRNVIVDATNLNKFHVALIKEDILYHYPKVIFEDKIFDVSVDECIRRDKQRDTPVGSGVIRMFYKNFVDLDKG